MLAERRERREWSRRAPPSRTRKAALGLASAVRSWALPAVSVSCATALGFAAFSWWSAGRDSLGPRAVSEMSSGFAAVAVAPRGFTALAVVPSNLSGRADDDSAYSAISGDR
jgi:hypothetical protein